MGNCVADGDAADEAPIAIAYRGFDGAPQARSRPQVYGVLACALALVVAAFLGTAVPCAPKPSNAPPSAGAPALAWRDVAYASKNAKILAGVSGFAAAGEIVDALDAVLLLHRGRVAFAGPPKDVLERFRAPGGNAVDLLLDNLKGDGDLALRRREDDDAAVEILVDGGGGGPAAAEDVISEPPPSLAPPGLAGQCAVLCRRELRDARRDPAGVVSHAAPMALLGGLVALAYGDLPSRNDSSAGIVDRYGLAFLLVSAVALFSLSAAPKARRAALRARRDRDSHGAAPAFVAAALVGDALVLRLVPPLILGVAAVSTRCAAASGREPSLVAALLQLHYALAAAGRFLGAAAPSDGAATAAHAVVVLLALLLSGFFAPPAFAPGGWDAAAAAFPPGAAAYEAVAVALFAGVDDLFVTSKMGSSDVKVGPFGGSEILDCYGYGGRSDAKRDHAVLLLAGLVADAATLAAFRVRML